MKKLHYETVADAEQIRYWNSGFTTNSFVATGRTLRIYVSSRAVLCQTTDLLIRCL